MESLFCLVSVLLPYCASALHTCTFPTGPGRHVLPEENYRHTQVVKLTEGRVRLGPLHILYIKEGYLGGAFRRNTGTYEVFSEFK